MYTARFAYKSIGENYELTKPYAHWLPFNIPSIDFGKISIHNNIIILELGYVWNGANVIKDDSTDLRASALHDAIYTLGEAGLIPEKPYKGLGDKLFKAVCIEDGRTWIQANLDYLGLLLFGDSWKVRDKNQGDIQ